MHHSLFYASVRLTFVFLAFSTSLQSASAETPTIETVVVRGHPFFQQHETERELNPGGVTLIDTESLLEKGVGSLADLLRYTPGVFASSNSGTDDLFFSSRGSNLDATNYDMNGIKLLVDGLPVTTADGNNHNRVIDPLSVSYAIVARGANALSYGASTLGGAIDFTSPNAHMTDPLNISVTQGSHGYSLARVSLSKVFDDRWDAQLSLENKLWHGFRGHNEQARRGVYSNIGLQLDSQFATRLYFTWLDNDQELPGALTEGEFDQDPNQASTHAIDGDYQRNVKTFRVANKSNYTFDDDSRLEFGFSYESQSLYHPIVDRILVDFDGPGPMQPQEVFSLLIDTDHRDLGTMVRYNLVKGAHNLRFGLNAGRNRVTGGNYRNLNGKRNGQTDKISNDAVSIELYALDRWTVAENWTLVYGLQAVSAKRDVATTTLATGTLREPSDRYEQINPRLGLIYNPGSETALYANLSRLFEAPTNFELEDDLSASNSTLKPMQGVVVEIGSRGEAGTKNTRWQWDVSLYHAKISDEILSRDDPLAPGTSLVTNFDDTIHSGIEAQLKVKQAKFTGHLESILSLSLNRFKFVSDSLYGNNDLPAAPTYILRGEVLYRDNSGLFFGPNFDLVGKRYADFINSHRVNAYHLLGLRAGYKGNHWELFVEGKNLTDEKYVSTLTVNNVADTNAAFLNPGEPRSVYAGFKVNF